MRPHGMIVTPTAAGTRVRIKHGAAQDVIGVVVEHRADGLFVVALPDPWRSEWVYGSSHLEEVET